MLQDNMCIPHWRNGEKDTSFYERGRCVEEHDA